MKSEIEGLAKRVTKLVGPETPEEDRAIVFETDLQYRVLQCLTDKEKRDLCTALIDLENLQKDGMKPNEETWLTTRPPEQQEVVRKIIARYKELEQEGKSS